MNFGTLFKVFDTAVALGSMASRIRGSSSGSQTADRGDATSRSPAAGALEPQPPSPGVRGYLEARLTNVLVAALREAFDRDHARLELERSELQEQGRRAERALQMELWRQTAD